MKLKYIITVIGLLFCVFVNAQNGCSKVIFKHYTHNFGKLKFGEEADYKFEFKNISDSVVVITNVKAKCGCTTTDWTRKPLAKNKKGFIEINYDTKIVGRFTKSIFAYVNGDPNAVRLTITGTVSAPRPSDEGYQKYIKKHKNN